LKNVSLMAKKLTDQTSIIEHRQAQATLKDAKDVVLGKDPDTAIQINNNDLSDDALRARISVLRG